jgi:hypothetical protein
VIVSPHVLGDYPTLRSAYGEVLKYFSEWLAGERPDKVHGAPNLPVRDGDKLTIGVSPGQFEKNLDRLVWWEASFSGVGEAGHPSAFGALGSESHASIGGGTLQGFANSLVLVRDGNLIRITGDLIFRVKDKYDFSEGDLLGLRALEDAGLAKGFDVLTETWRIEVEGFIRFEDGRAIRALLRLTDYRDVTGGVDNRPTDFSTRRRIR